MVRYLFLKMWGLLVLDGLDEFIHEGLGGNIDDFQIPVPFMGGVSDGLNQVGLT